jgi:hypothetical protein
VHDIAERRRLDKENSCHRSKGCENSVNNADANSAEIGRNSLQFGNHKVDSRAPNTKIAAMLGTVIPRFHVFAADYSTSRDARTA